HSDQGLDPHSPITKPRSGAKGAASATEDEPNGLLAGLFHAHFAWMFVSPPAPPFRYAPDLLKDPALRAINRFYWAISAASLVLPAAIGFFVIGGLAGAVDGFVWGGLVRMLCTQHATWSVNSACHTLGSRPYDSGDMSRNCAWLAIPTFGEAWHNNHHAFPTAAFHGMRWYQIDLAGLVIRALRAVRLVDRVVEPSAEFKASRRRDARREALSGPIGDVLDEPGAPAAS
ncbi:hypothetical protein EON77_21215, partial [bacterium]